MSEAHQLRVGIGGEHYHGELQGQRITVISLFPEPREVEFLIEEVVISEKWRLEDLQDNRCHCFIDVPTDARRSSSVYIFLNMVMPQRGGSERFCIGGAGSYRDGWRMVVEPSSPQEILEHIRILLQRCLARQGKLEKWLAIMTPPGWTLKTEAR